jgi:hypothetical protein
MLPYCNIDVKVKAKHKDLLLRLNMGNKRLVVIPYCNMNVNVKAKYKDLL